MTSNKNSINQLSIKEIFSLVNTELDKFGFSESNIENVSLEKSRKLFLFGNSYNLKIVFEIDDYSNETPNTLIYCIIGNYDSKFNKTKQLSLYKTVDDIVADILYLVDRIIAMLIVDFMFKNNIENTTLFEESLKMMLDNDWKFDLFDNVEQIHHYNEGYSKIMSNSVKFNDKTVECDLLVKKYDENDDEIYCFHFIPAYKEGANIRVIYKDFPESYKDIQAMIDMTLDEYHLSLIGENIKNKINSRINIKSKSRRI